MWCKGFRVVLVVLFLLGMVLPYSFADEGMNEIAALKAQVQELMQRIEKLESEQAKTKETTQAVQAAKVDMEKITSKLKLKGRAALGFLDSGKAGSYPAGSFEIPDAKIQFSFQPDEINTVVMRFNLNNATAQVPLLDYFFLKSKDFLPALKDTPFSLETRLGRFKLGFGEETWSDNRVEGALPSNSAGAVSVSDEGLEFAGKIKLDKLKLGSYAFRPLGWVVSVSDGTTGVGSANNASKAVMAKLYYTPINPLYLSASYYDSGDLGTVNGEMSIAGLVSRPGGANNWQRNVWGVDARYDFQKGKKPLEPPAYSDSKGIVRLSYGEFQDSSVTDRTGNFGFVDGLYNLNKKVYLAGRYSFIGLGAETTATLNSVSANRYDRYSLGAGYRWTENTLLKVGYDWNKSSGADVNDADDNLLSVIAATQF